MSIKALPKEGADIIPSSGLHVSFDSGHPPSKEVAFGTSSRKSLTDVAKTCIDCYKNYTSRQEWHKKHISESATAAQCNSCYKNQDYRRKKPQKESEKTCIDCGTNSANKWCKKILSDGSKEARCYTCYRRNWNQLRKQSPRTDIKLCVDCGKGRRYAKNYLWHQKELPSGSLAPQCKVCFETHAMSSQKIKVPLNLQSQETSLPSVRKRKLDCLPTEKLMHKQPSLSQFPTQPVFTYPVYSMVPSYLLVPPQPQQAQSFYPPMPFVGMPLTTLALHQEPCLPTFLTFAQQDRTQLSYNEGSHQAQQDTTIPINFESDEHPLAPLLYSQPHNPQPQAVPPAGQDIPIPTDLELDPQYVLSPISSPQHDTQQLPEDIPVPQSQPIPTSFESEAQLEASLPDLLIPPTSDEIDILATPTQNVNFDINIFLQ